MASVLASFKTSIAILTSPSLPPPLPQPPQPPPSFSVPPAPTTDELPLPPPEELQALLKSDLAIERLLNRTRYDSLAQATDPDGTPLVVLAFQEYQDSRRPSLVRLIGAMFEGGALPDTLHTYTGVSPLRAAVGFFDGPLFVELLRRGVARLDSAAATGAAAIPETDILAYWTTNAIREGYYFSMLHLQLQDGFFARTYASGREGLTVLAEEAPRAKLCLELRACLEAAELITKEPSSAGDVLIPQRVSAAIAEEVLLPAYSKAITELNARSPRRAVASMQTFPGSQSPLHCGPFWVLVALLSPATPGAQAKG